MRRTGERNARNSGLSCVGLRRNKPIKQKAAPSRRFLLRGPRADQAGTEGSPDSAMASSASL
jgi:hypothetical protein